MMQTMKAIGTALMALLLITGCAATTTQPKTGLINGSTGERAAVVKSGFSGDYSMLKPGPQGRAALVYVNPKAKWKSYHSIIIDPVLFWSSNNSVPPADQKVLTSYFYEAFRKNPQTYFILVNHPGQCC